MTTKIKVLKSKEIVKQAIVALFEKKAENIVLYKTGAESSLADWILVCEGDNVIHTQAIAKGVVDAVKTYSISKEGMEEGRWALIDYADVLINVMVPQMRKLYNLEQLWSDVPRIEIQENTDYQRFLK